MTGLEIRPPRGKEVDSAAALMRRAFEVAVAPTLPDSGANEFAGFASDHAFRKRINSGFPTWIARNHILLGLIQFRLPGHLLSLFVDPDSMGQGIGRALVEFGVAEMRRRDPELARLTLHATDNALGFYLNMGFRQMAARRIENGIASTAMALDVRR